MTTRTRWRVGFAVAVAVQLLALYWPRVAVGGLPQDSDKVVHLLLFAAPAYLGVVAVGRLWPAALLALHAPVSELVQGALLPARAPTTADAVANLAGVALGTGLAVLRRRSSTHPRSVARPPRCPEDVTIDP